MNLGNKVLLIIVALIISACSQKVVIPEPFAAFSVHSHPPTIKVKIYRECLVEKDTNLQECIDMKDGLELMNTIVRQRFILKAYEKDINTYMESVK